MSDELRWCLIWSSILILLVIMVLIVVSKKKSKNKETKEFPELLEALGGVSNISNINLNGSRISLSFESKKNIDNEMIKENGVETIVLSNKKITLVIGKKASSIYRYLQGALNQ